MLKKMGYALVCASALMSASLYSLTATLKPSMVTDWPIPAHGSLTISNDWFDPMIAGFCEIRDLGKDETAELRATVINPEVTLNRVVVNPGETVTQTVQNGSRFDLSATLDASVLLENLSAHNLVARCSTYELRSR